MRYVVSAIIMVLTCLALSTAHATTSAERESLRGLAGVAVVIEVINSDAQADGLSEEAVLTAVELILKSSGIRVLSQLESFSTPSAPFLYVRINTMKTELAYAVDLHVALDQRVSLVQRPEHKMSAATYELSSVGMYSTRLLRDLISDGVEPDVKAFATDFLAVNPR